MPLIACSNNAQYSCIGTLRELQGLKFEAQEHITTADLLRKSKCVEFRWKDTRREAIVFSEKWPKMR
jgi:hypothetical protein